MHKYESGGKTATVTHVSPTASAPGAQYPICTIPLDESFSLSQSCPQHFSKVTSDLSLKTTVIPGFDPKTVLNISKSYFLTIERQPHRPKR